MSTFLGRFLASVLGTIIGIGLLTLFFVGGIAGLATQAVKSQKSVEDNTVLTINLQQAIPELSNNIQFSSYSFNSTEGVGIYDMVKAINSAKEDDKIEGIYLKNDLLSTNSIVKLNLLREAIQDFKSAGKFVVSYSKFYSQGAYYLSTVADSIFLNPLGLVDFKGFGGTVLFYKNMLEKAGVEMEVFYAGEYKGGSEPFRRTNLSPENREQLQGYVNDLQANFMQEVSAARGITVARLNEIADNYLGGNPKTALAAQLVDRIAYQDEVETYLRKRLDLETDEEINTIELSQYAQNNLSTEEDEKGSKIAVLFAEGTILDGDITGGLITDEAYVSAISDMQQEEDIKAVVLRINSPGGSATASENIWRALQQLQAKGIPVIVSMSDYAASGGYYIAMASDRIFAERNTLTGSIGVYRQFPVMKELMNEKIGITVDTVKSNVFAGAFNPYLGLSEQERAYLNRETQFTYQTFLKRVADNRDMTIEAVDKVARGRIWTTQDAIANGLVDEEGGLEAAITYAAEAADLSNYQLVNYPKIADQLTQLLKQLQNPPAIEQQLLRSQLGDWFEQYEKLKALKEIEGVQAKMPYEIILN